MDTAHSKTSCPVYLHPACSTNPDSIRTVQQATGRFIVLVGGRPTLKQPTTLPAFEDFSGFNGGAA